LRFGVREHGMAAVCNGIAAHGGLIPFGASFLNFVGYALGAIRLSALSGLHVLYVMTHDSIGLGEDGPTHQPIETLASLRSMPHMITIRPADGNEVSGAYKVAINKRHNPTTLALSRQGCAVLEGTSIDAVAKGAYALKDTAGAQLLLVATGSEVQLAVSALPALAAAGITAAVISMPSWELFEEQSAEYQQNVFPAGVPVLSIECAATCGWERVSVPLTPWMLPLLCFFAAVLLRLCLCYCASAAVPLLPCLCCCVPLLLCLCCCASAAVPLLLCASAVVPLMLLCCLDVASVANVSCHR